MSVTEQIANIVDEALIFLAKNNYKNEIEVALKAYKSPFINKNTEVDLEQGFNSWLLHDYKQSKIILDYFKNKHIDDLQVIRMMTESVFSVFKVSVQNKTVVFKDIITQADYVIDTDRTFNDGDLINVRVYPFNHKYHMIDLGTYHPTDFESTIRKSIMSKYNEYCSNHEPMALNVFIKQNSVFIYHLTNIIEFYESELSLEDELHVLVATYAVKDRELLIDKLTDTLVFQITDKYDDELILMLLSESEEMAEVVVTVNQVEVESNSTAQLQYAKSEFEKVVGDLAVFLKEEKLQLEDLL